MPFNFVPLGDEMRYLEMLPSEVRQLLNNCKHKYSARQIWYTLRAQPAATLARLKAEQLNEPPHRTLLSTDMRLHARALARHA